MNEVLQRQLQANIDAFTANIAAICAQAVREEVETALRDAARASTGSRAAATTTRATTTTAVAPRRGRPPKGRGSSLDVDTVFAEVKRQGDRTSDVIAKSLGVNARQIRLALTKLIGARKVRTKGIKRGMRYTAA